MTWAIYLGNFSSVESHVEMTVGHYLSRTQSDPSPQPVLRSILVFLCSANLELVIIQPHHITQPQKLFLNLAPNILSYISCSKLLLVLAGIKSAHEFSRGKYGNLWSTEVVSYSEACRDYIC